MPQHKRGPWSQSEDQHLLHLVTLYGAHNWVRISSAIQTRSPKQCRERFHQNLKPTLNHDPITPEEGILIEQMVAEMGKRWAEIARRLRGRSDNAVKNWWNGGMNRRRRNNQQRRTELEVRQQPPAEAAAAHHPQGQTFHIPQQPLPQGMPNPMQMQQQFWGQPIYAQQYQQFHAPQQLTLPSNGPPMRNGMIETPLPSPSAYSQMSADGAPSLVSDSSSQSARSPQSIELPPLSGQRNERRQSSAPTLRLGVPGAFAYDSDFQSYLMPMAQPAKQPMLQEGFIPQQQFQHPAQYYAQQQQQQQQQHQHQQMRRPSPMMPQQYQMNPHQQPQAFPPQVHLPSQHTAQPLPPHAAAVSADHADVVSKRMSGLPLDPDLIPMHGTPSLPSAPTPDGSPKDKMSLSAITH